MQEQEKKATTTRPGEGRVTMEVPREWKFPGITSHNTTQVPDEFIDYLMPILPGSEFKVLIYITRRTFGFRKESDTISIDQMVNGIRKKNGEQLDYGTGLSRQAVVEAIRSLAIKNIIFTEHRKSRRGGDLATTYRLNIKGADSYLEREGRVKNMALPQGQKSRQGGSKMLTPPGVKKVDSQQTVFIQHTEKTTTTAAQVKPPVERHDRPAGVVVAQPSSSEDKGVRQQEALPAIASELVEAGVSRHVATELATSFPHEAVRKQIMALPHRKATEPAALLVKAIREDWALPKQYERTVTTAEKQAREIVKQKKEELKESHVDRELGKLTEAERDVLRKEAEVRVRCDNPFFANRPVSGAMLDGFVRLIVSERLGNAGAIDSYREIGAVPSL